MNVGTLTSFLKLDRSEYTSGINQAQQQAKQMDADLRKMEGSAKSTESAMSGLGKAVSTVTAAFGAMKIAEYIKESTIMAARYETMGVVMATVGKNVGYSASQMEGYTRELQRNGIAMIESRSVITKMAQANLDLSKSSELARMAQDAAVIGNINSSEAFERVVRGIQTGEQETLKTIGINVQWEAGYRKMEAQLGRTRDGLTAAEKTQSRMNTVMEAGVNIAGVYEASMDTAGKQMLSMTRYSDDLQVKFGLVFQPIFSEIIKEMTGSLKDMSSQFDDINGKLDPEKIKEWGATVQNVAHSAINVLESGLAALVVYSLPGLYAGTMKAITAKTALITSILAENAANTAAILAEQEATAAKVAATQAALVAAEAKVAQAHASQTAIIALFAESKATEDVVLGQRVFAASSASLATAKVALTEATIANTAATEAQAAATAAAASVTSGLGAIMGLLVSPVVLVTAAVAAGVYIWKEWGAESGRAADQALEGLKAAEAVAKRLDALDAAKNKPLPGNEVDLSAEQKKLNELVQSISDAKEKLHNLVGEGDEVSFWNKTDAQNAAKELTAYEKQFEITQSNIIRINANKAAAITDRESSLTAFLAENNDKIIALNRSKLEDDLYAIEAERKAAISAAEEMAKAKGWSGPSLTTAKESVNSVYDAKAAQAEQEANVKGMKDEARAAEELAQSYQSTLDKFLPLVREQREYNEALAILDQMDPSHSTDNYNTALANLNASLSKVAASTKDLTKITEDYHAAKLASLPKEEAEVIRLTDAYDQQRTAVTEALKENIVSASEASQVMAGLAKQQEIDTKAVTDAMVKQTTVINVNTGATLTAAEVHTKSITDMMRSYRQLNAGMTEHQITVDNLSASIEDAIARGKELGMTEAELTEIRQAGIKTAQLAIDEQNQAASNMARSFLQAAAGMNDYQIQQDNLKVSILAAAYTADMAGATWGTLNRIIDGGNKLLQQAAAAHAQAITDMLTPYRQLNLGMTDVQIAVQNVIDSTEAAVRAGRDLGMTEAQLAEIRSGGSIAAQRLIDEEADRVAEEQARAIEDQARAIEEATRAAEDHARAMAEQAEATRQATIAAREAAYKTYTDSREIMTRIRQLDLTDYQRSRSNLTSEYFGMTNAPGITGDEQGEIVRALVSELAKLATAHAQAITDMLTPYQQLNSGMNETVIWLADLAKKYAEADTAGKALGLTTEQLAEIQAAQAVELQNKIESTLESAQDIVDKNTMGEVAFAAKQTNDEFDRQRDALIALGATVSELNIIEKARNLTLLEAKRLLIKPEDYATKHDYLRDLYSLPSFAVGTDYVPNDMVAKIHQGERITPARFNQRADESTSDLLLEIKALRIDNQAMAKDIAEMRKTNKRLSDIAEKSDTIGPAPARAVA